jgi:predicted nucleic acid-binding protein
MTYLVDTNVLLRWSQTQLPEHPLAFGAVDTLQRRGEVVFLTPQNLVEYWSVASRPASSNGLGNDPAEVDRDVRRLEQFFPLVPDIPAIHGEWRLLVVALAVSGRQVHDARLAAVMRAHGIDRILTFNTADFLRDPGITAVHPRDAVATA